MQLQSLTFFRYLMTYFDDLLKSYSFYSFKKSGCTYELGRFNHLKSKLISSFVYLFLFLSSIHVFLLLPLYFLLFSCCSLSNQTVCIETISLEFFSIVDVIGLIFSCRISYFVHNRFSFQYSGESHFCNTYFFLSNFPWILMTLALWYCFFKIVFFLTVNTLLLPFLFFYLYSLVPCVIIVLDLVLSRFCLLLVLIIL